MKRTLSLLAILFFLSHLLMGQEENDKKWELSGYQKSLQGLLIFNNPVSQENTLLTDIFLHNRLNFKWYPTETLTFSAGLRSRYFFGDFHQSIFAPDFKKNLKEDSNDFFNLQLVNVGERTILQSVFDRFYLEYEKGEWEVALGRQRINWGIGSVWNPHDIFNAFSFVNFDYEERPGVDAVRITKYIGFSGGIEIAAKAADSLDDFVAGMLYKTNKWNYDFQFLGGYSKRDIVVGLGWAGAIKNVGFKGETSFFKSTIKGRSDSFAGILELNYAFAKGTFLTAGMLYNATDNTTSNLFNFELDARNLYPYHWAITSTVAHPITPLFRANLTVVYSPVKGNPLFLSPVISYSLAQNVDADLIGQLFFEGENGSYKASAKQFFLRMKWSF